jgi:cytoskeleton protein RodZ
MKDKSSVLGLATVRRNRGITLQQISESTKIGVRSLEAIEVGDFRKLPGGIYTTSYIRQYARAIDYDEDTLLEYYRRQMSAEPGPARTAQSGTGYGGLRPASTPVGS